MPEEPQPPVSAEYLREFYAVTISGSVYHVTCADGSAAAKKISGTGNTERNLPGPAVAILRHLQMFVPEGSGLADGRSTDQLRIESVNTSFWRGGTGEIAALFMNERKALACSTSHSEFAPSDERWKTETLEVLGAIGTSHPFFYVYRGARLADQLAPLDLAVAA